MASNASATEAADEDEESESSSNVKASFSDEQKNGSCLLTEERLEKFRQEWRKELCYREKSNSTNSSCRPSRHQSPLATETAVVVSSTINQYDRARALFLEGTELERNGLMHEAIRSYAQAVRLVPDIEHLVFVASHKDKAMSPAHGKDNPKKRNVTTSPSIVRCTYREYCDMEIDISMLYNLEARVAQHSSVCLPENNDGPCFMSKMPIEIVLVIFKWVVSSELDVRMLEQLSMVCTGFYLLARDVELWRLIAYRTWGHTRLNNVKELYPSWRQMYIKRQHLLHNGIYIAKMTYIRHGETSFQDQYYRPWHMIAYYRYVRFFADGSAVLVTTSEQPSSVVPALAWRNSRFEGLLKGHYVLTDSGTVQATLYRPINQRRRCLSATNVVEQRFSVELKIRSTRRKRNAQLKWIEYGCVVRCLNGQISESKFDLNDHSFPPFYFSRVKSYSIASHLPLQ